VSNTGLRKILLSAHVPAPSIKGLQYSATKVGKIITKENTEDMHRIREELKTINELRGTSRNIINTEGDCCYNSPLYSGVGRTPFQPATQCTYIMAEHVTREKKVIALSAKNKLCKCPPDNGREATQASNHADHCSANLSIGDSIGNEGQWALECLQQLNEDGLEVKHFTTDPDISAFKPATSNFLDGKTKTKPEHLIDTRHLSENQRKYIKRTDVVNLMPGKTVAEREKLKDRFANDCAKRCQAEFTQALAHYRGDISQVQNSRASVVDSIILCYQGDHSQCFRNSFVCRGEWIRKSAFLTNNFQVISTEKTDNVLRRCIEYRLSATMIYKTKLNSNTQKVEAVNRSIRRSVAHNITYVTNFVPRVHCAIHSVNNGPGSSITVLSSAAGTPIMPGSSVHTSLKQVQRDNQNQKTYRTSDKAKLSRCAKKHKLYELYRIQHKKQITYKKGQLLDQQNKLCDK
jgi:hypothetical protein